MTPRPSSPSSLLASSEPALMELDSVTVTTSCTNNKDDAIIQTNAHDNGTITNAKLPEDKNDDKDDELLLASPKVETSHHSSRSTRRRRTFGTASSASRRNNNKTNGHLVGDMDDDDDDDDENPSFSQMVAAINNDNQDDITFAERVKSKRPWELEEEEELVGGNDNNNNDGDLLLGDSQESATSPNLQETDAEKGEATSSNAEQEEDGEHDDNDNDLIHNDDQGGEDDTEAVNDNHETSTEKETTAAGGKTKQKGKDKKEKTGKDQPNLDDLIFSIDTLFCEANKETVTVKHIITALEDEYSTTLTKVTKKLVRSHLVDLMTGKVKPSVGQDNSSDEKDEEIHEKENSDLSGDESSDPSSDEEEAEEEVPSEYEDEEEMTKSRRLARSKKQNAKGSKAKSKSSNPEDKTSSTKSERSTRRKSTRKSAKTKKGSIHAHAEKLRQKRMQELRVRNEELQLQQSEEDRKRAELIAAKFETNTDELRWQRLEDRLDLLQKLDQKRIHIIEVKDIPYQQPVKLEKDQMATNEEASVKSEQESDDSDDDMELEIVGAKDGKKPLFPSLISARHSTALSVLDMADRVSPMAKQKKNSTDNKNLLAGFTNKKKPQVSPSRNGNARAMLRNQLLKKQRKMGNMWLARELGYKNEQEHLRDCIEVEKKKREIVLQRETARLEANERTQLRERLREPEFEGEDEAGQEADEAAGTAESENPAEEEDEEMMLAKQMEQETGEPTTNEASTAIGENEEEEEEESNNPDDEPSASTQLSKSVEMEAASNDGQPDNSEEHSTGPATLISALTDSQEETQDEYFPDAQEAYVPTEMELDKDESDETGETQTLPGENPGSQPNVLKSKDEGEATQESSDDENETQQFETQAPPRVPLNINDKSQLLTKDSPLNEFSTIRTESSINDTNKTETNSAEDDIVDTDDEQELDDSSDPKETEPTTKKDEKKDRNAGWKAILEAEAKKLKSLKKRKGRGDFLEIEADEEEEEEVAGLEDFGFSVQKKKDKDDDDDIVDDQLNADDLKDVVDELSDDEGDEETGEKMRRAMLVKEEKERHKEMLRRMREGYDGRRGGIAGSGVGARGMHRFDQLVAADNREAAKELGLLNDDELDSDNEENGDGGKKDDDEEEDEAALIDKMLKDRFLRRSSVELEENFSDDEDEEDTYNENNENKDNDDDKEQEKLAKRFAKRARMERLMEEHGNDEEFADSRLIEEDTNMKEELKRMKNGLARKRSITSVSTSRSSSISTGTGKGKSTELNSSKRQKTTTSFFGGGLLESQSSLTLALKSSRQQVKNRTSFLGNSQSSSFAGSQDLGISSQKSISFSHVVFQSCGGGDSQLSSSRFGRTSQSSNSQKAFGGKNSQKRPSASRGSSSLWAKVMATGPQKRR